jgi:uncharacterized membrane protein HdeD (DUF308 family)
MAQAIEHVSHDLWWAGMFQGVFAILFGIVAVFWPGLTLITLVHLFSAFVLIWGVVSIISSILRMNEGGTWWLKLLFGVGDNFELSEKPLTPWRRELVKCLASITAF